MFGLMAGLNDGKLYSIDFNDSMLTAVAVFSAGGRLALEDYGRGRSEKVRQLTHQVGRGTSAGSG